MPKNPYLILGIDESATQAEIDEAYRALVEKYREERFLEGEAGERASKMLDEVYRAYDEVMAKAKQASFISGGADEFYEVTEAIKAKRLDEAQQKLDNITTRSARWNYLQANIYYRRGWLIESKKQLETAIKLDPDNTKYKDDLERLKKEMNPSQVFDKGNAARPQNRSYTQPDATGDACCDSCMTCLCLNALCNCCWS